MTLVADARQYSTVTPVFFLNSLKIELAESD